MLQVYVSQEQPQQQKQSQQVMVELEVRIGQSVQMWVVSECQLSAQVLLPGKNMLQNDRLDTTLPFLAVSCIGQLGGPSTMRANCCAFRV